MNVTRILSVSAGIAGLGAAAVWAVSAHYVPAGFFGIAGTLWLARTIRHWKNLDA
jgi:hypothetical protein